MAALWKLPVVYVIENNRYSMGTSLAGHSASHDLYVRAQPYGISGVQVDGMNVVAVKAAADIAIEHARTGEGPYVLEMLTYRYRGHSMSDPAKYRSKDEVSRMRAEHDPIDQAKHKLSERGFADEAKLKDIDRAVKEIVAAAAAYAPEGPEPDP